MTVGSLTTSTATAAVRLGAATSFSIARVFDRSRAAYSTKLARRADGDSESAVSGADYAGANPPHSLHSPHFASPSDFSALPLSSLSAFMNAAKSAEP